MDGCQQLRQTVLITDHIDHCCAHLISKLGLICCKLPELAASIKDTVSSTALNSKAVKDLKSDTN